MIKIFNLFVTSLIIKSVYTGNRLRRSNYKNPSEHTMVTESNVFPYMAALLKGNSFISSGAVLNENWVLTSADGLFLMRNSIRKFRVRLGSINYKKGGELRAIKYFEIHPNFDDRKPNYDLAMLMLSAPIRFTENLRSIRMLQYPLEVTASHFIVTSWPGPLESKNTTGLQSMDIIKRNRILSVTHLHPLDPEECDEELSQIGTIFEGMMCLDPTAKDLCMRDTGAPVVLNGLLWGIISSWKDENCDEETAGPIFVSLVSSRNTSTWIRSTMKGVKTVKKQKMFD